MKTAIASTTLSKLEGKGVGATAAAMSLLHAMGLDPTESLAIYIAVATGVAALAVFTAGDYPVKYRVISMLRSVPIGFAFAAVGLWAVSAFTDWPRMPEGIIAAIFFFSIYYGQNVARTINSFIIGSGRAVRDGKAFKDRIGKQ